MGVLSGLPLDEKFGKLQIVREVEPTQHPNGKMKRLVEVVCDCGVVAVKSLTDIKAGQQKSCGSCPKEQPYIDLVGRKIGKLTVVSVTDKRGPRKERVWLCSCECGNTVEVDGLRIRNERKRNCGVCATPLGAASIGDVLKSNEGYEAEIVGFEGKNYFLKFKDKHATVIEVASGNAKRGNFCNPYHPSVAGVGYFGVGKFVAKNGTDRHTVEYEDWNSMMKRCYIRGEINTSYHDKEVSEEWKCFQDFAEWATIQPNFGKEGWDLEKDLIVKGNKTYSAETCVYLPREVNSFIKRKRCNDLPLGVDIAYKYNGTPYFRVQGREDGKNINLGSFYNVEEAFSAYKVHKEYLAKKLAEKWKPEIPDVAYKALLNYTVEITD